MKWSLIAAMLVASLVGAAATAEVNPPTVPLDALDRIVGNSRTVVFGEDSHGMAAVHAAVPQMFEHLVTAKGFRGIVFEVQWGVTEGLRDFLTSDRTTLSPEDEYWLDGAFASKETAAMLVWIRNWNRAHPTDQIGVWGYQPEQPVTDFHALFALVDRVAPDQAAALRAAVAPCRAADPALRTEFDFMGANRVRRKAGQPSFTADERAACLAGLDRVQTGLSSPAIKRTASRNDLTLVRLRLISLRTYVAVLRKIADAPADMSPAEAASAQGDVYAKGDAARFEILTGLRSMRFPRAKLFFWMHNWHAAKHASEMGQLGGQGIPTGTVSLGERIARAWPGTVTIGNVVPCGTTCTEPADSVEPRFIERFGNSVALVDLRDPARRRQFNADAVGSLYANHHGFGFSGVRLSRQFDAILYIPASGRVQQ